MVEEDWRDVDEILPATYGGHVAEFIGAQGVPVDALEVGALLQLQVFEVSVHGQTNPIQGGVQDLQNILTPSRAIHPSSEPYWVGETDGPKHLYILSLKGDIPQYLGMTSEEVDERMIVKVGFSKSPLARCGQIQAAYPSGSYRWEVMFPKEIPLDAPYPNAKVAIAGEDAMKARLQTSGGASLGHEFFLADLSLVHRTWAAGRNAAEAALTSD